MIEENVIWSDPAILFDGLQEDRPAAALVCEDCYGEGYGCCLNADIPLPGVDR